jgi:hypothetical protein
MKNYLFSLRSLAFGGLVAAFAIGLTQSAAAATPGPADFFGPWCPPASLSQPFPGDPRWYTLAPGEAFDNFAGTGWDLTGGAAIVTETLADGTTGSVLDLPADSSATSPPMCVDGTYPLARMEARTLGKKPDSSATFYTQPVGSSARDDGMPVLGTPEWSASPPAEVAHKKTPAEQVQFRFVAGRKAADLQVYNLYIDPHAKR